MKKYFNFEYFKVGDLVQGIQLRLCLGIVVGYERSPITGLPRLRVLALHDKVVRSVNPLDFTKITKEK